MTISDAIAGRRLEALRAAVTGEVFVPGEDGYDQARQAWNLAVDERPAAVVVAESAADVVHAVRFARSHGMRTAFVPRPTEYGPAQETDLKAESDWDVVAKDMEDLARQLGLPQELISFVNLAKLIPCSCNHRVGICLHYQPAGRCCDTVARIEIQLA